MTEKKTARSRMTMNIVPRNTAAKRHGFEDIPREDQQSNLEQHSRLAVEEGYQIFAEIVGGPREDSIHIVAGRVQ